MSLHAMLQSSPYPSSDILDMVLSKGRQNAEAVSVRNFDQLAKTLHTSWLCDAK